MDFHKYLRHITSATLLVVLMASCSQAAETKAPMQMLRTPGNVRFGIIGGQTGAMSATLLVVAMSIEDMQREPVFTEVSRLLAEQGFLSIVIEPPCHGEDRKPDEPDGLAGWRHRLDRDENVVQLFNTKARAVLDHVIAQGLADPGRVAVIRR